MLPDLELLRALVVVAEERSITRAATRLHITQQSLSTRIRVLERRLGAPLLHRSSRGVGPTAVGEVVLHEAAVLLASAERMMDTVGRAVLGESLALRVGFLSSLANEVMPPVVSGFGACHPAVELHTADLPIAELVAGVRGRTLDAAISRPPLVDDLRVEPLGSEAVVLAMPMNHRFAARRQVRLAELADEAWVLTPRSSWPPWHREYDANFAAAGYRPRVVRRSTTPQGLLALVAAGVGITRLAASARSLRTGGVRFATLRDERAGIVLLTRRDAENPAIPLLRAAALDALRTSLATYEPPTGASAAARRSPSAG